MSWSSVLPPVGNMSKAGFGYHESQSQLLSIILSQLEDSAPEIAKVLVYCRQLLLHLCEKFGSLPEVPNWDLTPFNTIEGYLTMMSENKLSTFGLPERGTRVIKLLRAIIRGEHYADRTCQFC